MKPTAFIRTKIETAWGDVLGLVSVTQVGTSSNGEPMFDLFRGELRLVSAIPLRGLRRAKAAPRLPETLHLHPLLKSHHEGCVWRQRHSSIVTRMKATTPEAYCQEFWDNKKPSAVLLAFARGAVGWPFTDASSQPVGQVSKPAEPSTKPGKTACPTRSLF